VQWVNGNCSDNYWYRLVVVWSSPLEFKLGRPLADFCLYISQGSLKLIENQKIYHSAKKGSPVNGVVIYVVIRYISCSDINLMPINIERL
jgi:hypothetical protein